ncbi:unnamed protein product [Mucor hiemalis]
MTSLPNESTTTDTNVENKVAPVEAEQVTITQIIKEEPVDTTATSTHALNTALPPPIQEPKLEEGEDTPMIEATGTIENNTNTNDTATLLKMEEILCKEVNNKDDTLVKPPPSPPPTNSSASDLPTTQPQSISTQPNTNHIEPSPSTLNTDTAVPTPETPAPTPITTFEEIQNN